jgi:hypothetical protein
MKKTFLLTGLVSVCLFNAQIRFEKGYFINNSGKRTDVLIKNLDWKNNPTVFEYKTEISSDIKTENISNIQEFGIGEQSKYVRKTVLIDHSAEQMNTMSDKKNPEFIKETLFLKYLIDGKADLFYYENNDVQRFFFSTNDSEIKQLVYKPYYLTDTQIAYNEEYKKQLSDNLNCTSSQQDFKRVKYELKDLIQAFKEFNRCSDNTGSINYEQALEKKDLFNLNIRPGINFSTFETDNSYYDSSENTQFGRTASFRIGIEAEFIMPFNKNKWALFAEPTYQYYKSETESVAYPGQYFEMKSTRSADYKSIELPFGVRHYFFITEKSKLFVNAAYVFDFELNSKIRYDFQEFKIQSGNNLVFGAGYKYNDKFLVEFRASTNRNLLMNYPNWSSKYQTFSLILGYTLF